MELQLHTVVGWWLNGDIPPLLVCVISNTTGTISIWVDWVSGTWRQVAYLKATCTQRNSFDSPDEIEQGIMAESVEAGLCCCIGNLELEPRQVNS